MKDEINFSKKNHRVLSPFLGEEMLFDFATDTLDAERKAAVEDLLRENAESANTLKKIRSGINYAESLKAMDVSKDLMERAQEPSSYFDLLLHQIRFADWPAGMKMGFEVMAVAVGIISISLIIPWQKLNEIKFKSSQQVILAELVREKEPSANQPLITQAPQEVFPDEGKPVGLATTTTLAKMAQTASTLVPSTTMMQAAAVKATTTTAMVNVATQSPPTTSPTGAPLTKGAQTTTTAAGSSASVAAIGPTEGSDGKRIGYLYRGTISITNVPAITPKIVERLEGSGGRKAGDVPLGWRKDGGSYFHLTIPESRYQDLINIFNDYGKLKMTREKHDRVMPDGIIRVIITIDEAAKSLINPGSSLPVNKNPPTPGSADPKVNEGESGQ